MGRETESPNARRRHQAASHRRTSSTTTTTEKVPSCGNCRARKVKCDRRVPECQRCTKLDLTCYYPRASGIVLDGHSGSSGDLVVVGGSDLTQAGFKRRRTRNACRPCRALKAKCSGTSPCSRCESMHLRCEYSGGRSFQPVPRSPPQQQAGPLQDQDSLRPSRSRSDEQHQIIVRETDVLSGAMSPVATGRTTGRVLSSPSVRHNHEHEQPALLTSRSPRIGSRSPGLRLTVTPSGRDQTDRSGMGLDGEGPLTRAMQRQCIDAFFANEDSTDCLFLHRGSVLSDWSQNKLNPNVLKILCATGLRSISEEYRERDSVAFDWAREVQHDLLRPEGLCDVSLGSLQALVLVIRFYFTSTFSQDAWILLSVAARVAFTMRLNHEKTNAATDSNPDVDQVQRELQRRLMWAIFVLDKLFSGGIEDLTVCPTSRLRIRLPCSDTSFQRGIVSKSAFLRAPGSRYAARDEILDRMDIPAYRMQLLDIRDRILRYTRELILDGANPVESEADLRALDDELQSFRDNLPAELQLNSVRLTFMAHSEEATAYMVLHGMRFLCRCDLHRFLIPGIRESVSTDVFARVPKTYIDHCQRVCFDSAIRMCDLWSDVYDLDRDKKVNSHSMAIAIYQCLHVLGHLAFLMPPTGPYCLEELQTKLTKAAAMISQLGNLYIWLRPCIADINNMIASLGRRERSRGGSERGFQDSPHARSKHGYVRSPATLTDEDHSRAAADTTSVRSRTSQLVDMASSPVVDPRFSDVGEAPLMVRSYARSGRPSQRTAGASTPRGNQIIPLSHPSATAAEDPRHYQRSSHREDNAAAIASSAGSNHGPPPPQPSMETQDWPTGPTDLWWANEGDASGGAGSFTLPLDPMELILNPYASNDPLAWAQAFSRNQDQDHTMQ